MQITILMMGKRISSLKAVLILALVACYALVAITAALQDHDEYREEGTTDHERGSSRSDLQRGSTHHHEEEGGEGGEYPFPHDQDERGLFILQDARHVVKTEAGSMKVVMGTVGGGCKSINTPMHIGFITMEPKSLFIPQYLDSTLIIFIRQGEARIGSIYKDDLVERQLKPGDVFSIQAGSAFYIVNTGEGQRLHAICSIDTSESLNWHAFQSFFIGGGSNPASILGGFDHQTLATAFNVSYDELGDLLSRQQSGPIVYMSPDSHPPSMWSKFLDLEQHERLAHLKRVVPVEEDAEEEDKDEKPTWSFRKFLNSVFAMDENRDDRKGRTKKSIDSYNLYDRTADFKNNFGWSVAVDGSDYHPLKRSGMGVYLVNLTAGSMMAPHINPTATEYGIVLRGTGNIQVVFPNGTLAMNAEVHEGDIFWVPRYFPFCQIASRTGPFEFFGFTTSAHKNRPQFLVGQNSLLQSMRGPEFATAFGVSEDRLREILDSQREGVILPTPSAAPAGSEELPGDEDEPAALLKENVWWPSGRKMKDAKNFGINLVMAGFD